MLFCKESFMCMADFINFVELYKLTNLILYLV